MKRFLGIALAVAISASISNLGAAQAGEVKLLSALVMKPALIALSGDFERTSGHKLVINFGKLAQIIIIAGQVRR